MLSKEITQLRKHSNDTKNNLLESKVELYRSLEGNFVNKEKEYIKSVIDIIDEPILKFKVDEMFFQAFPEEIDKNEAIRRAKRILGNAGLNINDLNQE